MIMITSTIRTFHPIHSILILRGGGVRMVMSGMEDACGS